MFILGCELQYYILCMGITFKLLSQSFYNAKFELLFIYLTYIYFYNLPDLNLCKILYTYFINYTEFKL